MKNTIIIILVLLSQKVFSQDVKKLDGTFFPEDVKKMRVHTIDNKEITFTAVLDSLKNKVVFVDFWASWCGPCVNEMKESKKVQNTLKDKNIAYLFLSTDVEDTNWRNGLKVINIEGYHFRMDAADKHLMQNLFNIKGIPYYVILDAQGKIADARSPWPREPRLLEILNSLTK